MFQQPPTPQRGPNRRDIQRPNLGTFGPTRFWVQDGGVAAVAAQLPRGLRQLWLGLGGCAVGRDGARHLARHLAELGALERLHLDCSRCRIGAAGAQRLCTERAERGGCGGGGLVFGHAPRWFSPLFVTDLFV